MATMKAAVIILFAVGCNRASTGIAAASPGAAPDGKPFVTLDRTECFGTCPGYKISIYKNGRVLYEGRQFVKLAGAHVTAITASQLDALDSAFKRADFCHREPMYFAGVTDVPWAIVSYEPRSGGAAECPNRSVEHAVWDGASKDVA